MFRRRRASRRVDLWQRVATVTHALVDTIASSATTFGVGLVAAILLPVEKLGLHQVFFVFSLLLSAVHFRRNGTTLVRLGSLRCLSHRQLIAGQRKMALSGALWSILIALPAGYFLGVPRVPLGDLLPFVAGSAAVSVALPLRDMQRTLGHVTGNRGTSAIVSILQFGATAMALVVIATFGGEEYLLLSFGLTCLVSAIYGTYRLRFRLSSEEVFSAQTRTTLRFSIVNALPQINALWGNLVLTTLYGVTVVGQAAASGQIGQGLFLFITALNYATIGDSTRAGGSGNLVLALKARRCYIRGSVGVFFVIIGLLLVPNTHMFLNRLLPNAFSVDGLVFAYLGGVLLERISQCFVNELTGAERFESLTRIEVLVAIVGVLVPFSALGVGVFAIPLALACTGICRIVFLRKDLEKVYSVSLEESFARS